jgi:hypothetical protein
MKRTVVVVGIAALAASCTTQEPAKPTPAPAKPAPTEAPKPAVDAGTPDAYIGMMEKYAIWKAKKEADEKLAKELAEQEAARLRKFDKSKLPIHTKLLAFERKTRAQIDAEAEKLKGKPDAAAQMEKAADKLRKPIEAQAKLLRKMDPSGGNSNIGTDHDVVLNLLANDYPAAQAAAMSGDEKPLAEVRAELDKRFKKMDDWLAEVKTWKESKAATPKAAKAGKKKGKKK